MGAVPTVTDAVPLALFEQLASDTLINSTEYVPAFEVAIETEAWSLTPTEVIVFTTPKVSLYVNVYGLVPPEPVKVICGDKPPIQTEAVPDILAVGNGFTLITAFPDAGILQAKPLASATSTKV